MLRVFLFMLVSGPVLAQTNWDTVKIRPLKLTENLYMMTGAGGNMALLAGPEGNLLVDDQFAQLSDKIKGAIANLDPGPVRFVINTHLHGDHTGGNENFKKIGVTLMAHDNVRARMMKGTIDRNGNPVPPRNPEAWPMVTFESNLNVHLNGQDIELVHVDKGHTDGDVVIRFRQANVMHTGDAFVRGRYPIIDRGSGGSFLAYIHSLSLIHGMADDQTRIIPGHGALGSRADVKALHDVLVDIRDQVTAALKKGTKVEDIAALGIADKYDTQLGQGFIKGKDFVLMVAEQIKTSMGTGK